MYSCNLKDFNNIFFFRNSNRILFFSDNIKVLSVLNFCFKTYILSRNLKISKEQSYIGSIYSGFSFLDWSFYKSLNSNVFFTPSYLSVKKYRCKLKMLVKNFSNVSCLNLVKSLNVEINEWREKFNIASSYCYAANFLDFYVYKLLWKWCKRFHPRRPNFWIFEKYWKNISGKFSFFSIDISTGRFCFLSSHSSFDVYLKTLPASVCIFDFRDRKKIYSDLFKRTRVKFYGVYGVLFDSQKGICPRCNNLLFRYNSQSFRIIQLSSSIRPGLVLVHDYCKLL